MLKSFAERKRVVLLHPANEKMARIKGAISEGERNK